MSRVPAGGAGEVEVDTVRLRGPVRDAGAMGRLRHLRLVDGVVVGGSEVLPSGARLSLDSLNGGKVEASVEFSAPKVALRSNVVPLPLRHVPAVCRQVVDEAAGFAGEWAVPFGDLRVTRLDVDRDFVDVDHAGPLLAALSKLRVAYNSPTRYFPDPERGNAANSVARSGGALGGDAVRQAW